MDRVETGRVTSIGADMSFVTSYTYDACGRVADKTISINGRELSSECGYTIQGWPCHTQSRLDGEIIFEQNLEYWNTSLPTSIPRYDGIVLPADINGNSSYRLLAFVTDYLGSVRSVVDMPSGTVVEENDYYPLGLRIADPSLEESSLNRWRYNAKEDLSGIAGIPFSDYGARLADHFTGRWIAPDPMAEKYYAISPYVFCNNNSVIFADLDRELPQVIVGALGEQELILPARWLSMQCQGTTSLTLTQNRL